MKKHCAYHQIEHEESAFNATQLKRKNSAWCRAALSENKRLKAHGLKSNSKASGKGGRPRWDTEADRKTIQEEIEKGNSYSAIGRMFTNSKGNQRTAAEIRKIALEYGWESLATKKLKNPEEFVETHKVCTECGAEKLIEEFPLRPDRKERREAKCKPCYSIWKKKHNHIYYEKHDGAFVASKRRALISQCSIGDSKVDREYNDILKRDPCSYCQELIADGDYQLDHIDPINPAGETHGDHSWTNFTSSCSRCNNSKNNKKLLSYLLDRIN